MLQQLKNIFLWGVMGMLLVLWVGGCFFLAAIGGK